MPAKIRKAILTKDSTYYVLLEGNKTRQCVAFNDKLVYLKGGVIEGRQKFISPIGSICYSQDCNFKEVNP